MKETENYRIKELINRFPDLKNCENSIISAYEILENCFCNSHKLFIAGNGGSCSDCEHIVGELMKGFNKSRPISAELSEKILEVNSELGDILIKKLQAGLPAISLSSHPSLNTAIINDIDNGGELIFAQQLQIYGNPGDVLLSISTSGNSKNILLASIVAKAKGLKVICLTGKNGGKLDKIADCSIKIPLEKTYMIQELHLPVYHCLCLMLEDRFF